MYELQRDFPRIGDGLNADLRRYVQWEYGRRDAAWLIASAPRRRSPARRRFREVLLSLLRVLR